MIEKTVADKWIESPTEKLKTGGKERKNIDIESPSAPTWRRTSKEAPAKDFFLRPETLEILDDVL